MKIANPTTTTSSSNPLSLSTHIVPSFELTIGDYRIKRTIGEGSFSKVKLATHQQTKQLVAIKVLDKQKLSQKDQERIRREMQILISLSHPNVIQVNEILENKSHYYIVMEYCAEGELFNYIVHKKRLSEEETSFIFYQIINGLEYIHSQNISHRDLKPENILMMSNRIIKIIDFGLSNYYNIYDNLTTPCGSPCYASPEMIIGKGYDGRCIDIWSTGIIVYAMICGYLPFEDKVNQKLFRKILKEKQKYPSYVSRNVKDIINKMLCKEPKDRITLTEIKRHPFYLEGKNIFHIKFNPAYDFCEFFRGDEVENYGGSYFQTTVSTEQNKTISNVVIINNNNNNNNNTLNSKSNNNNNKTKEEEGGDNVQNNNNKMSTRNTDKILNINNTKNILSTEQYDNNNNNNISDLNGSNLDNKSKHNYNNNNNNNKSVPLHSDFILDSNTYSYNKSNNNNNNNKTVLLPIRQATHQHFNIHKHSKDNYQSPSKQKPITKLTTFNTNNFEDDELQFIKVNKRLVLTSAKKQHMKHQSLKIPLMSNPNKLEPQSNRNCNLTAYNMYKHRVSLPKRLSTSLDRKRNEYSQLNQYHSINNSIINTRKNSNSKYSQTANNSKHKQKKQALYISDYCQTVLEEDKQRSSSHKRKGVSHDDKRNKHERVSKEKRMVLQLGKVDCFNKQSRSKSKSIPKTNSSFVKGRKYKNQSIDLDVNKFSKKCGLNIYQSITVGNGKRNCYGNTTSLKLHHHHNHNNIISYRNNANQKGCHKKNNTLMDMTNIKTKLTNKMFNNEGKGGKNGKCSGNNNNSNSSHTYLNNTFSNRSLKC